MGLSGRHFVVTACLPCTESVRPRTNQCDRNKSTAPASLWTRFETESTLLATTAQTGVPALTSYWSMKRQSLTPAVFVIVLATGGLPAAAQSMDTDKTAPVEVTPYASFGSYPSSRVGAAVAFRLTPNVSVESEVGYRRDMTGRLSATASLLYDLPRIGRFMPYLAAGAGLEEYATALKLPDGALVAQPRTAFAINAGGGLKVRVDDNWGIRTDARWFNGLGRDAGEHWRLYNGVTFPTGRR